MAGITRIKIVSSWNDWRVKMAEDYTPVANDVYRSHFHLADGDEKVEVTKEEALARYDWKEGIDAILTTESGTRMTLQEKFLDWWQSTVTFEETKTSGEPGAWYYCTAQYYFVGYVQKRWDKENNKFLYTPIAFRDYMCVDLPAIHRADEAGEIHWENGQNGRDGRRATFRYVPFSDVPEKCIIFAAPHWRPSRPSAFSGMAQVSA